MTIIVYDKQTCREMVRYAEANPIPVEDVRAAAIGVQPLDTGAYLRTFEPGHVVIGFTVEEQEDGRHIRHFSIQPPLNPAAVTAMLREFGVDWDMTGRRGGDPCIGVELDEPNNAVDLYFEHPDYTPALHDAAETVQVVRRVAGSRRT